MRITTLLVAPAILFLFSGCTTLSLEKYTQNQNQSGGECSETVALDCLATVADNPNVLPSYAVLAAGVTTVTDSVTIGDVISATTSKPTIDAFSVNATRQPKGQWTVDPAAEYERLEALHAACIWMLFGPQVAFNAYPEILGDQSYYLDTKPHFGVSARLSKLPPTWFKCGRSCDVPKCARYTGHAGKTWVWVMPEDSEAFAQFSLALLDIASLDLNYSVYSMPILVSLNTTVATKIPDSTVKTNAVTITTSEWRVVKREYKPVIEHAIQQSMASGQPVNLTRAQWLAFTDPWFGTRTAPAASPSSSIAGQSSTTLQVPTLNQNPLNPFRAAPPPVVMPLLDR